MNPPQLGLGVELKGRKALLACQSFSGFSGSEIVTLELAEALSMAGASVTIAAANVGGPIDVWAARAAVPVTPIDGVVSGPYDLLWVHHWPVWTRLEQLRVDARRIVYSCLSPFEPRELPPFAGRALHLYAANSEETRARLVDDLGLPPERVALFLNSAPRPFFDVSLPARRGTIERLAIVSSHVPPEINELGDRLRADGVFVEVIGDGSRYERVTADLLVGFDAVITIGRTVQYCLAAGVPVFVYDRFGGPGWLTEANWQLAERFNFSGRCTRRPRTTAALRTELITGYPSVVALTEYWRRLAAERYAFEPNLAATLKLAFAQRRSLKPVPSAGLLLAYSEAYAQLQAELTEQHVAGRAREADRLLAWGRVSELQAGLDARGEKLEHIGTQLEQLAAVAADSAKQLVRLGSLQSRVAELEQGIARYAEEIQRAEEEALRLRQDLLTAQTQARDGEAELAKAGATIVGLKEQLAALEQRMHSALERRDTEVAALRHQLTELEQQRAAMAVEVAVLSEARIRLMDEKLQAQGRVDELSANVERLAEDLRAVRLRADEAERAARRDCYRAQAAEAQLAAVFGSRSWRLTTPLRSIGTGARKVRAVVRRAVLRSSQAVWRLLPLGRESKDAVKAHVFQLLAPMIGGTGVYRRWTEYERARAELAALAKSQPPALSGQMANSKPAALRSPAYERLPVPPEPVAVPLTTQAPLADTPVTVIAFYLPQFHAIPENDAWWGAGFTEWTNVTRARPQFVGHYQPHEPGELGYYDLRVPEVQHRQVELAKLYGVGAFCFYFYWFAGHRLLERPVLQYLNDPSLDLPFCLCWANENWSRRWDGLDQELLISQKHSPEDDIAFIEYLAKYLRDRRYVRVAGRPLVLVYRPCLLPDARATAARWRDWCRANGIGEIFLAYTQSFSAVDPAEYGFDAAIEFPPNNSGPPDVTDRIEKINPDFRGVVYDWRVFVERSRHYATPAYRLYRGVNPSWDNEARKIGRGSVLYGSTPDGFREWLANAAADTIKRFSQRDERLVFVNAWNEWAEGAHLEPDRRYGYAWLQAVRDALSDVQGRLPAMMPPAPAASRALDFRGASPLPVDASPADTAALKAAVAANTARRVVIVTHDAYPHGAQLLALHLAEGFGRWLAAQVDIVVLGDGPLKVDFARFGRVHDMAGVDPEGPEAHAVADKLRAAGTTSALCNTAVSGKFLGTLKRAGFYCVSLIHEMPGVLSKHGLQHHAEVIARNADCVVFPAQAVADGFNGFSSVGSERVRIRPQGLYKRNRFAGGRQQEARRVLREQLGLPETACIVLGVGYADHRKGIDLFVQAGNLLMAARPDTYFVWVGHHDLALWPEIQAQIDSSPFRTRFILPGRLSDTDAFFAGADVFALTSREDPFPSVVLESLEVAVPVVGFEGTGGCCALISEGAGLLVDAFDVAAYADALGRVLDDSALAAHLGHRGADRVRNDFSFRRYVFDLAAWLHMGVQRVSVVVPNYNYARYLEERLTTIINQTYPVYELIVLDDASTDNSVQVAKAELTRCSTDHRLVVNEANSGSVFQQWRRGVDMAGGDLVWIAEADDLADFDFLDVTVPAFDSPSVVLSYTQSRQMAPDGTILCDHYLDYTDDISREKWRKAYIENGLREIREAMSVKNTIPNVSAVVFRRHALAQALDESAEQLKKLRVAGDWLVYVAVLARGDVAFTPRSLNSHRRHQESVTGSNFNLVQLQEIVAMQRQVRRRFGVDDSTRKRAGEYAQRLFEQFGLTGSGFDRVDRHPLLATEMLD